MGIKSRNVPQNDWSLAGRGTLARERKRMAHKKEVWDGDRFCKLSWFGIQMLSGVCQQSVNQRTARMYYWRSH